MQNKYQKNVRKVVLVLLQRKDHSTDSEADTFTPLKMESLLKMLSKHFLPRPKAFLPFTSSKELAMGSSSQEHTDED